MPNNKGSRAGLGFMRTCICCSKEFEIYSVKQRRCRECSENGKSFPKEYRIQKGIYNYKKK